MRSATSRSMPWRSGSTITRRSGGSSPSRSCSIRPRSRIWGSASTRSISAASSAGETIEPLQLVLGLSIPALVMAHVIGVRLGYTLYGHQKLYPQELYLFFVASNRIWTMTILLIIAWVHGCIGIYFWLRLKPFFTRAAPYLLAAAVLIPTLSLLGVYQGGRSVADRGRRRRMAHAQSHPPPARHDRGSRDARPHHRRPHHRLCRPARTGAGGARRARLARAAPRHDRAVLRQRQDGARAEGPLRAGGEPAPQCAACQRLRRPRPLLDLPHPHHRRSCRPARAVAARGLRARARRHRRSLDPACLPAAAGLRPLLLPALHAPHAFGGRTGLDISQNRPGALSRQPVRGHARFDAACREAAAIRHRFHRQPLPRRRLAGRDREWRPAEPVRRRRHAGAVRAVSRSGDRLPAGAEGCRRHRHAISTSSTSS